MFQSGEAELWTFSSTLQLEATEVATMSVGDAHNGQTYETDSRIEYSFFVLFHNYFYHWGVRIGNWCLYSNWLKEIWKFMKESIFSHLRYHQFSHSVLWDVRGQPRQGVVGGAWGCLCTSSCRSRSCCCRWGCCCCSFSCWSCPHSTEALFFFLWLTDMLQKPELIIVRLCPREKEAVGAALLKRPNRQNSPRARLRAVSVVLTSRKIRRLLVMLARSRPPRPSWREQVVPRPR